MLRFEPDDWLEGLLRPLVLADPSGYVYIEFQAPDLRFAALGALTLLLLVTRRFSKPEARPAVRTLVGLWLIFYIWTFAVGNGRYFMAGLLLVGPSLVALVALAPFSHTMRLIMNAGLIGLQLMVVTQHFQGGRWALMQWTGNGPGLPLADTSLRYEPAVFLTVSSISHSILVPQFDPRSRWANIAGLSTITRETPEWDRLHRMLAVPLPKYAVIPIVTGYTTASEQPSIEVDKMLRGFLGPHGLRRDNQPCEVLRSHLRWYDLPAGESRKMRYLAYWFCPLAAGSTHVPDTSVESEPWSEAFAAVEQACPRYFPPGGGMLLVHRPDKVVHRYAATDTYLYVDDHGNVMYLYFRALNPTRIGSVDEVRHGKFKMECEKLPGRYVYPWKRG